MKTAGAPDIFVIIIQNIIFLPEGNFFQPLTFGPGLKNSLTAWIKVSSGLERY